jgi:uncharacterized protein
MKDTLIKSLQPNLHEGVYVFCTLKDSTVIIPEKIICFFRESEGDTIILRKEVADAEKLCYSYQAAWITITLHTSLHTVGLTASFTQALAAKGISCNVVAGFYHDHLFVPKDKAGEAMKILNRISTTD